ncbi:MAG: DUF45 domain-containing protein [Dehalococcoidales bacterium]|nr:DUF45 domain-containing protein [Dehalococcoidales bacterium]
MAQSATIKIDGIGKVLFERSRRARHVNISVKPFKGVRVAVPEGLSFRKAQDFVHSKLDWIRTSQVRMRQYEQNVEKSSTVSEKIDRTKAKFKIKRRLNHLADRHGFSYNRVFIRNQKTRWGSCSRNNNISLNMKLVRLPEELMDYVIFHELVHTRIKNHSISFWTELDNYVGDSKKLASGLKKFSIGVI